MKRIYTIAVVVTVTATNFTLAEIHWIETFDNGVGRFGHVIDEGNSTFVYDAIGQDLDCVFFREPLMGRRLASLGDTYTENDSFGVVIEWTPTAGSVHAFPHMGFFDSASGGRVFIVKMTDNRYEVKLEGQPGVSIEDNGTDWFFGDSSRIHMYVDGESRSITLETWIRISGELELQGIASWDYTSTAFSIDGVGVGNLIEENPGPTLTADIDNAQFFAAGEGEKVYITGQSTSPVQSSPLANGVTYELTVMGTYRYNSQGERADAEWHMASNPDGPIWLETGDPGSGLDLLVNGEGVDWLGSEDGVTFSPSTFSPSHVYKHYVTGDGSPLSFVISDSSAGDNDAGLLVEINPVGAVPAVSEWGLAVMILMTMAAGTVAVMRKTASS